MAIISSMLLVALAISNLSSAVEIPEEANSIGKGLPVHEIISRLQWGGKPPIKTENLSHPVDVVIVAHTATSFCTTIPQCSNFVKKMQEYHFQLGFDDISYNFLIGGDGNIYEGRGWDAVNNSRRNRSITVSFIGNYLYDYLSEEMIDAFQELLSDGVDLKKLKDDFKIVCHNQTMATLSPGINVYSVIKSLPHFESGRL